MAVKAYEEARKICEEIADEWGREWVGGEFDPEDFEINDVRFDNPDKRWETAFK